jgi:hypothetical protein
MSTDITTTRRSYTAEWACASVALCYSLSVLLTGVATWGRAFDPAKIRSYLISAAGMFLVPLACSIAAITGSKGRPKGRIGFLALLVTLLAVILYVVDLAS